MKFSFPAGTVTGTLGDSTTKTTKITKKAYHIINNCLLHLHSWWSLCPSSFRMFFDAISHVRPPCIGRRPRAGLAEGDEGLEQAGDGRDPGRRKRRAITSGVMPAVCSAERGADGLGLVGNIWVRSECSDSELVDAEGPLPRAADTENRDQLAANYEQGTTRPSLPDAEEDVP